MILKKNGRRPKKRKKGRRQKNIKKTEDDLKKMKTTKKIKMENDLNKNGRRTNQPKST